MSRIRCNRHDEGLLLHATSELEEDARLHQKDVVQDLRCKLLLFIPDLIFLKFIFLN